MQLAFGEKRIGIRRTDLFGILRQILSKLTTRQIVRTEPIRRAEETDSARRSGNAAGSKELYAEHLLKDYGNAILRLASSYVHNMADAEEVLQDTLIRVLEAEPAFENAAHEKAYLMTAASNVAKNRILYNTRRTTDELNEELVAEEREDLRFVWEAVKGLPDTQREVIHLFYQEGYKTAEIAEILGRKEATIRSDLKRARERLKEILKEEFDFG